MEDKVFKTKEAYIEWLENELEKDELKIQKLKKSNKQLKAFLETTEDQLAEVIRKIK